MIRRIATAMLAVGLALGPSGAGRVLAIEAAGDSYATNEDTKLVVPAPGVFANDTPDEGTTLCVGGLSGDADTHGVPDVGDDGSLEFDPEPNFNGTGEFSYGIVPCGGGTGSDEATVTVTINPVNDAPTIALIGDCADGTINVQEDSSPISEPCVSFDPGPDNEGSQTVEEWVVEAGGTIGVPDLPSVTGTGDTGTLNVTFNGNEAGAIDVSIRARDSGGTANGGVDTSNQVEVKVQVAPVNDAPSATADAFQVLRDRTLNIAAPGVLVNDSDIEGDSLTALVVTAPVHGTLTLAANGSFSYTPAAGYVGPDTFAYHAFDGSLASATRVVSLMVTAVAVPTPAPTPTPTRPPAATAAPTAQATAEPSVEASASAEPSAEGTLEPSAAPASVAPSGVPSPTPVATVAPEPVAESGGLSLPLLLVVVLFAVLLVFAAAYYVPRWLEARRSGGAIDDGSP